MTELKRKFGGRSIEATMLIDRARRGLGEVSQETVSQLDAIAAEFAKARRRLGVTSLDMASPRSRALVEAEVAR